MAKESIINEHRNSIDLALIFASCRHNVKDVLQGVRSILGPNKQLAGGSTSGIINNNELVYEDLHIGVLSIKATTFPFEIFLHTVN